MKKVKNNIGDLVSIKWRDAHSHAGWQNDCDRKQWANSKDCLVWSIGYITFLDKESIIISQNWDGKVSSCSTCIPRTLIKNIEKLRTLKNRQRK